jgi:mannose-6-phosphate isomerase-like protein (cupin superfamily)
MALHYKSLLYALTAFLFAAASVPCVRAADAAKKIVLIGGPKSHGIGEHDFPNGIALLKTFLDSSPDAQNVKGFTVVAYPNGWPTDPSALDGASTIVFYFDGLEDGYGPHSHPLVNEEHRAQFERLMKQGVGLVALHQSWTVPADDSTINLQRWLGAARYGKFDRTFEPVIIKPATPSHPISNGVGADEFILNDEFYPTISFFEGGKNVIPILTGKLHTQFRNNKPVLTDLDKTRECTIAWAFEREDGGRAFGFSGLHYLREMDDPHLRKLLLNAIFWTAKIGVPEDGVRTTAPADAAKILLKSLGPSTQSVVCGETVCDAVKLKKTVTEAVVTVPANNLVVDYPWGRLTWYASRELKNSDTMTVGQALIRPGQENPMHFHPNCDEILHVLKGHILQVAGDKSFDMKEGDTISIPAGVHHSARNIGKDDAILAISFSSADRQVVGEN